MLAGIEPLEERACRPVLDGLGGKGRAVWGELGGELELHAVERWVELGRAGVGEDLADVEVGPERRDLGRLVRGAAEREALALIDLDGLDGDALRAATGDVREELGHGPAALVQEAVEVELLLVRAVLRLELRGVLHGLAQDVELGVRRADRHRGAEQDAEDQQRGGELGPAEQFAHPLQDGRLGLGLRLVQRDQRRHGGVCVEERGGGGGGQAILPDPLGRTGLPADSGRAWEGLEREPLGIRGELGAAGGKPGGAGGLGDRAPARIGAGVARGNAGHADERLLRPDGKDRHGAGGAVDGPAPVLAADEPRENRESRGLGDADFRRQPRRARVGIKLGRGRPGREQPDGLGALDTPGRDHSRAPAIFGDGCGKIGLGDHGERIGESRAGWRDARDVRGRLRAGGKRADAHDRTPGGQHANDRVHVADPLDQGFKGLGGG